MIPRDYGGKTTWENIVCSCIPCNTRKANHLPDECGMHLHHPPVEPHFVHLSWAVRRLTPAQAKYIRLFYGAETLHEIEGRVRREVVG